MTNFKKMTLCLGTVILLGLSAVSCKQEAKSSMETSPTADMVYSCPMHPEIIGKEGDSCSQCGMSLQAASPKEATAVKVAIASQPEKPIAGQNTQLTITITANGSPIQLETAHEKKYHLMLVNDDLSSFEHLHPSEQKDGTYTLEHRFAKGGDYLVYSDIKPEEANGLIDKQQLAVSGPKNTQALDFSEKLVDQVDGYTLTLTNGKNLSTNSLQGLSFSLTKEGKAVPKANLQLYLGATAHMAMIDKTSKDLLHIHPMDNADFPIYAETHIKKAGVYVLWVEFQTNNKVHTAHFVLNVKKEQESHPEDDHHAH